MQLNGIHHITSITGEARRNLDFNTRVLGLRLIAKTVNQDDPSAYHLFYGDEHGTPGNDLTFFEYPGARPGRPGPGMIHRIVWRVRTSDSIDFWARRLADEGVATELVDGRLRFSDPEGLGYELMVSEEGDAPLWAQHPEIPEEHALAGFEGVQMWSVRPGSSRTVLEHVLGAVDTGDDRWELRGTRRGGTVVLDEPPAERGIPGAGTVHHVAFAAPDSEHPLWPERLHAAGLHSTDVIDRHYFHSVYFREPGGVLYEIADDGPGFSRDQDPEHLGAKVILPPWLESRRDEIEARLTPLEDPRAGWATV